MGPFSAPLVCQTLLAKGIPWRNFYLYSLVLSAIALSLILFNFHSTHKESLADRKAAPDAVQFMSSALDSGTIVELQSSEKDKVSNFSAGRLDTGPPNSAVAVLRFSAVLKCNSSSPAYFVDSIQWAFIVFIFIYGGSETVFQGYVSVPL